MEGQKTTEQINKRYGKVCEFLKKKGNKELFDFAYSNGFSLATVGIFLWQIIGMIYYVYMRGQFSVYGIDLSYIIIKKESIVFQIIKFIGIALFVFITNYVVYWLLTEEKDKNRERKAYNFLTIIFGIFIWLIFVTIVFASTSALFSDISLFELVIDIGNNPKENFEGLFILLLLAILVNFVGFQLGFTKIIERKMRRYRLRKEYIKYTKNKNINKEKLKKHGYIKSKLRNCGTKKKSIKSFIIGVVLIIAYIMFVLFYFWLRGKSSAEEQKEYKVIFESTELEGKNYILHADNDKYICYPIVLETEGCYILTRLVRTEDTYTLERNYQKIINKENIQTFKIENIKNDELVNSTYIRK